MNDAAEMNSGVGDSVITTTRLEVWRAGKMLRAWCAGRNRGAGTSADRLVCVSRDNELHLMRDSRGGPEASALLRLVYDRGDWLLLLPCRDGQWQPYPHLARTQSIDTVIDELDRAPLHVHWD
jgi:hypothetical protein